MPEANLFEMTKLSTVRIGRISGAALKTLALAMRAPGLRDVVAHAVRRDLGIDRALALPSRLRGPLPESQAPLRARLERERTSEHLGPPGLPASWPRTSGAYLRAFAEGKKTPDAVSRRALAAARSLALETSQGPFCDYLDERARAASAESAERLSSGAPRLLEGVPVAVKEELDLASAATRLGTGFMPYFRAQKDALAVARLVDAGAIPIAQTPMTEYGMSPLGVNPHRRMPRNAHDAGRLAGGSSTGSAVAVALGLVPIAVGTDGGGSIRIPAAYNGIFGLKPTYGRIPLLGHGSPGTTSVVHAGALAGSSTDLALATGIMSGPAKEDALSELQPKLAELELFEALGRGVRGLKIGVPESEWRAADPDVERLGSAALAALERAGAELVPLSLELACHAPAIGYLTIALEAHAALRDVRREHLSALGYDLQVLLSGLDAFHVDDYLDAQRLRSALRVELRDALLAVDVIALPSTANTAPPVTDAEAQSGIIDPEALAAACRFAFLANLTGLPAVSIPVGLAGDAMPVGLQIVGDAWDEASVLQVAAHLEREGVARVVKPARAVDLLDEA
jgi:Asp-tRNA(Asn)/Glu-tRNA(Gln) amidotransferase A subunit family amidase